MTNNDEKLEAKESELKEELKAARQEFEDDYNPKPKTDQNMNDGARAGVELVGAIIGGALIGYGIDHYFETKPVFFLIFILLGVITGFYNIYKITMNMGTSVGFKGLKNPSKDAKQSSNYDNNDDD